MRIYPYIHNAEELGIALLGSPHASIAPPKRQVDRAEYGRRLAQLEGGVFTSKGYIVQDKEGEDYGA
jgi:hypothetical protein